MNEKTEAAPLHDNLRDLIGQAISDEIAAGAEQPDWCDSREIDRLADAVLAVLPVAQAQAPVAASEDLVKAAQALLTEHEEACLTDPMFALVEMAEDDERAEVSAVLLAAIFRAVRALSAPQQHAQAAQDGDKQTPQFAMREVEQPLSAEDRQRLYSGALAKLRAAEADSRVTGNAQAALSDDALMAFFNDRNFYPENIDRRDEFFAAVRRLVASQQPAAAPAPPAVQVKTPIKQWEDRLPESDWRDGTSHEEIAARDAEITDLRAALASQASKGAGECSECHGEGMVTVELNEHQACTACQDITDDEAAPSPAQAQPVADAAPVEAKAEPEQLDIEQSREYLVTFMEKHFTDKTYHRYIRASRERNNLAGDFAWQMARALRMIDAQPYTAQGDALSQQSAPSAQQERAWFKHWLSGLDGDITVDQVEFGRRVWAERARRASEGGA